MRFLNPMAAAVTVLCVLPPLCNAQTIVGVTPGDRVKVWVAFSEGIPLEGTFQEVQNGSLFFSPEGQTDAMEVPLDQVESVETFAGTKRQTVKGMGIGAGSGALLGIVLGFASGDDEPCSWVCFSAEEKAAVGGIALGITGGVIGLIAGALTTTDEWREVPLVGARPAIRRNRAGGVDFGLSVSLGR
jgi:hypothetical protein